jgi:hypothetical protein
MPEKKPEIMNDAHALGVVAHCVQHAPERRARQRVHGGGADEAVRGDQVVDLDLRAEGDAQHRLAEHAVALDAAFATEELGDHQRHRRH